MKKKREEAEAKKREELQKNEENKVKESEMLKPFTDVIQTSEKR